MSTPLYQTVLISLLSLVCLGLLIDGLRSGRIWAKGGKKGEPGEDWNAHRVSRHTSPSEFWFHAILYGIGAMLPWLFMM